MCESYQYLWWMNVLLDVGISVFVQAINFVLKRVIQANINDVGYKSKTIRAMATFRSIFYFALINTCFGQVIATIDTNGTVLEPLLIFFGQRTG